MKKITPLIFIVILITANIKKGFGQSSKFIVRDKVYQNFVADSLIKTVQFNITGTRLSYPVLNLYDDKALTLSFDLLSPKARDYAYTLVHCNEDWKPSALTQFEYLEGFFENPVENYEYSVNTVIQYVHYQLAIPNDDIQFTKSGNYALIMYDEEYPEKIVLTQRFMVYEDLVGLEVSRKRPVKMDYFNSGQEIDIDVIPSGYNISDPYRDLKLVVMQNYGWLEVKKFTTPRFINESRISYDYDDKNIFPGHKEFRRFDIRSLRYNRIGVKQIEFLQPNYMVDLHTDKPRTYKPYLYNEDFNGRYYIEVQEYDQDHLRSDYAQVRFNLDVQQPYLDGDVYIYGGLTNWTISPPHKMEYNWDKQHYEKVLLLKQGYYNYMYIYNENREGQKPSLDYLEGASYETENDYLIFVYHTDMAERYDRLVGFRIFNTLEKKH